jgi:molybdopterin/thiamine biosynthesis adenylyltransferase
MKDPYQPNIPTNSAANTEKKPYVVDLTRISGDGEFPCPRCSQKISPDDDTESKYKIVETKVKGDDLEELLLQCKKCGTYIRLTGFLDTTEENK